MSETKEPAVGALAEVRSVIESLDDKSYVSDAPGIDPMTIGQHVRHILDFYECFLRGAHEGVIDYDDRERNHDVETVRTVAIERIDSLVCALATVTGRERPVLVRQQTVVGTEAERCRTSVEREIAFLESHATHHLAIVSIIMRLIGLAPKPDLGVAASTLAYRNSR
ncbi:MAG: hypothetical protein KDI19_12100 [Pseudomonadales bacterium]|nr:hypothetical protein [Pseudomonadales bacterium]